MIPGSEERTPRRQLSHATAFLMQTSACLRNPGPRCAPGRGVPAPDHVAGPSFLPSCGCLRLADGREGGGEASGPLGFPWALSSGTGALRPAPTCRPPGVVLGVCGPPLPRGKRPREGRGGRAVGPSLVCRVAFIFSDREASEPEYKS